MCQPAPVGYAHGIRYPIVGLALSRQDEIGLGVVRSDEGNGRRLVGAGGEYGFPGLRARVMTIFELPKQFRNCKEFAKILQIPTRTDQALLGKCLGSLKRDVPRPKFKKGVCGSADIEKTIGAAWHRGEEYKITRVI